MRYLPKEMEQKRFMFFENNCLQGGRHWTGATIDLAAFAKASSGTERIDDVNLPKEVPKSQGADHASGLLLFLMDAMPLGTTGTLPMLAGASPQTAVMHAWHEVGSASPKQG